MRKNGAIKGKAVDVFRDGSSLERFLKKYARQFRSLTPRERDVLRLMAMGASAGSIARQLSINVKTARNYQSCIRKKLNLNNETDYIKYALAFGLIPF